MSGILGTIIQVLSLVFSCAVAYYSFKALNNCDRETHFATRIPLILLCTASATVILTVIQGGVPHWSMTMTMAASAIWFANKQCPLVNCPAYKLKSHQLKHP